MLAIVAAINSAQIGEVCPFGDIVITFERGLPVNVRIARNYRPDTIKLPELKAE